MCPETQTSIFRYGAMSEIVFGLGLFGIWASTLTTGMQQCSRIVPRQHALLLQEVFQAKPKGLVYWRR